MGEWSRFIVEIITPDRSGGRWVVTPPKGKVRFGEDDLERVVRDQIRKDDRYRGCTLRYCEDGEDLVIGVFVRCEPRGDARSGSDYVPAFDDS